MRKQVVGMLVILAMFVSSLPLAVSAQSRSRGRVVSNSSVGTDEYYRDETIIFGSRVIPVSRVAIHVGGDPQVVGGLKTLPAADEEDVPLDKTIMVVTKSGSGKVLFGPLEPTVNGKQVYVRRLKASKKILAVINCGNWTRELGANNTFECNTAPGRCVPGEVKSETSESISDDGKTKTTIVVTSDGCVTKIEKTVTITKTEIQTNNVCVPGAWVDVLEMGSANGKLGKSFKVSEAITQLPAEVQGKITSAVGKDKINYLLVQQGACENEKNLVKVRWFSKSGGWNWVSFLVGVGVGFIIGYVIRGTPDNPVLTPIKSTNTPPARTPITGSGTPGSGGILDTRPRKPQ